MAIIETRDSPEFNSEEIHERDLVRAKHYTWPEARNGLVAAVGKGALTVIFMPAIHRATCYFTVKAQDIADGQWEMSYTTDMENIRRVGGDIGIIGSPDSAETDGESAG